MKYDSEDWWEEHWNDVPTLDERALARLLNSMGKGDVLRVDRIDTAERQYHRVVYVDDRPGVREVRARDYASGDRLVYYVVKRRYVFSFGEDGSPLVLNSGTWGDGMEFGLGEI